MANVSIGGNVTDSVVVVGNDNFVVNFGDVNGGVVNIIKPTNKPKYAARSTPVTIKPRSFPALLDRENEFESIKKAAQLSVPVSVWGQQGVGKTSFIRHLASNLNTDIYSSGTVYLNVSGLGYEDLLQVIFDSFFESDPSYKPNTAEILRAMQNIKALIFLDDLQIGPDEATSILTAIPNSAFILISTERSFFGEGEAISLRGLPVEDSIKLFEKELSRPLSSDEKTTAANICSLLQGHPLHILQSAALARESGRTLESLLIEMGSEKSADKSMVYMGLAGLSESEKQIVALLATAGGNIVPLEHIKGIFKGDDKQNDIQRLITLGLVQAHSPKFSISGAMAASISAAWNLSTWQDVLLNYAINWLSQQPASMLVEESSELMIHTIKSAGERKKWREVIQLGRALEKFMILYKRWQAWSDILNLILQAAKALNDSGTQAWVLHQLGTRALYLGQTSQAQSLLTQALNLRKVIGDKAGIQITQHNINSLHGIATPIQNNASGCRKYLGCGAAAAGGTALLTVVLLVIYLWPSAKPPIPLPPSNTPTPTHSKPITITTTRIVTYTPTLTSTPTPTLSPTPTLWVFNPRPDKSDTFDSYNVPMRYVPSKGEFVMGANEDDSSYPPHKVYLDSFYIDKYEVTNYLYQLCVKTGGCTLPWNYDQALKYEDNQPIVSVTWFQAQSYCEWRGAQLPTEAQWEKSARGTDQRIYPWGSKIDCSLTNYNSCMNSTTTVGSYASSSPYGVYDMAGNVWEWTADWYSSEYYSESPTKNPLGPDSGTRRVLRGGSYVDAEYYQQVTYRNSESPEKTNWNIGFRCARSSP